MPFSAPAGYRPGVSAPASAPPDSLWFVIRGAFVMVTDAVPHLPKGTQAPLPLVRQQYLGQIDDQHVYAGEVRVETEALPGWRWSDLRSLHGQVDERVFGLAGRAVQIIDWDRSHQFCGRCGTPTRHSEGDRSRECTQCGQSAYPRLAPVMMALVRRGPDRILLARSPRFPAGMFSALAGFVEAGETLEQCIHREVFEEVGISVTNLEYFASQPWPFPHSLMIGFTCDHAGGELNPDGVEIEAADWFDIDALPVLPGPISIARRLIDATVNRMRAARGP